MTTELRAWMKLVSHLSEAPIGDINFLGGEQPASMRSADIGIVTHPKAQEKIRRVLERAPVMINLVFINHPFAYDAELGIGDPARKIITPKGSVYASGLMSPEQFQQTYHHSIKPDPTAVTIAFGMNEGDDSRPLSPWIIAHRIGHVLMEQNRDRTGGVFTPVLQQFNTICVNLAWDMSSLTINPDDLAHAVGTWKSARDKKLTSTGEFVLEAFAQFLIRGSIKLNPVPETFPVAMSLSSQRRMPKAVAMFNGKTITLKPGTAHHLDAELERWRLNAENTFRAALDDAVGKILVL